MTTQLLHPWDMWRYQHRISHFFENINFGAGWIPMGGGKTVSTLTAYVNLLSRGEPEGLLVVAPLRVARKVWPDEIKAWSHLHGLTVERIIGTPQERWDALNRRAHVHVINRENLEWLECQFIEGEGRKFKQFRRWPWKTVVLDEAQSFKSASSVRFKSARRIRRLADNGDLRRFWELTGGQAPNGYTDLWSQIQLLDLGQRLGGDEKAFLDRWFHSVNHGSFSRHELKVGAKEEIQGLLADIVLAMDEREYLGSPDVRYNQIKVQLSSKQQAIYDKMAKKYIAEIAGRTITAVNAGVCVGKLLQLANGTIYYDDKGGWEPFHEHKLEALTECLDSCTGPVMIAYGFRHDLERICETLHKYCDGTRQTWRILRTEQDEDDWNAGRIDYLLLHPASAGHGLNLQHSGSETIIWMGLTANSEWYRQLNARLIGGHRARGKKITIHHILAENTRDAWMFDLLQEKAFTEDDLRYAVAKLTF